MSNWRAGPGHRVFLPNTNIAHEIVDRHVKAGAGDRPAIVWDGGQLTYAQLGSEALRFAAGLCALGVNRNAKILIRSRNSPQACVAAIAAYYLGAVVVWANSLLTEDELSYIVENSEARVAVTTSDLSDRLLSLKSRGQLDEVIILDGAKSEADRSYDYIKSQGLSAFEPVVTSAEDPAFMLYSSGTTGRPKGILHAHRWIVAVGDPVKI